MPDGSKIVADSVGTINVLDSNGQFVRELHQLSNVVGLDFNANTQAIAALDEGGRLYILDLQGRVVREFQAHEENAQDVNWSQDGQSLVTVGDRGQRVRLWNVEGEQIEEVQISDPVFTWEDAGFDATGKPIMISRGTENQNVGNIDLSDFSEQGSTNIIPGRQMGNFLRQVKLGHPANVLVTTTGINSVSLWDLRGQQLVEFPVGIPSIQQLSIGPNNQKVAAIAEDGNTEVLELGGLSDLLRQGCQRIQNYLKNGPDVVEGDRTLCDDILSIAPSETPATPDSAPPDAPTPDPASPPETPVQSSSSLSASVPSIDFGESPVNIPQTAWVTFTNTSDTPLLISDLALADGATPSFTILGQGCSPAELQPEQPCAVEVQFLPEEAGIYESQLVVTSSGETVAMIPLSGVGQ